ncbi:hypothetical protein ACW73O_14620 [Faecalibacterium prausnitzii]
MALYQTQPDRKLRAKALAKEYGIGGHSHDYLDGSSGFVNHDWNLIITPTTRKSP